uniref:Uncharacterized protein MANES_01G129200 n=1 Tax=Rhizophora mucronata TaxID=61149 RepID=A0A2P2L111_RHIMU
MCFKPKSCADHTLWYFHFYINDKAFEGKRPQIFDLSECLAYFFWFFQWPKVPLDVHDCKSELKKSYMRH